MKLGIRNYSTQEDTSNVNGRESNTAVIEPVKYYEDIYTMKPLILKENKNKSGIYKFVNKLTGSFYIGSSFGPKEKSQNSNLFLFSIIGFITG